MRLKMFLMVCMMVCLLTSTYAQDPSQTPATREDVIKMLDALHTKETMKAVMASAAAQAKASTRKAIKQAHPQATEHDLAEGDRLMDQVISDLPLDEMIETMIPIYQRHFTRQDMASISAFYASPTGQKFVREMPAMVQESMEASVGLLEQRMEASQKKVQEMMNEMMERNRKSGEPKPKVDKS